MISRSLIIGRKVKMSSSQKVKESRFICDFRFLIFDCRTSNFDFPVSIFQFRLFLLQRRLSQLDAATAARGYAAARRGRGSIGSRRKVEAGGPGPAGTARGTPAIWTPRACLAGVIDDHAANKGRLVYGAAVYSGGRR